MYGSDDHDHSSRDDPDFTKRDSSRVSSRGLVGDNFKFQRKKKREAEETKGKGATTTSGNTKAGTAAGTTGMKKQGSGGTQATGK